MFDDELMLDRFKLVVLKMEKCICRRKRNEFVIQLVKVVFVIEELLKGKKYGVFLELCDLEEEEMMWV